MVRDFDEIETERLILRGIKEDDAELIVKWRSDPMVYRFFKFPHQITLEEHLNWFHTRYLSSVDRFDWICIEKKNKKRIGVFGMVKEEGRVEINFLLSPEEQHKGFAAEAIRAMIDYSVKQWKVSRIIAVIHMENMKSVKLVEKMGFRLLSKENGFLVYGTEV